MALKQTNKQKRTYWSTETDLTPPGELCQAGESTPRTRNTRGIWREGDYSSLFRSGEKKETTENYEAPLLSETPFLSSSFLSPPSLPLLFFYLPILHPLSQRHWFLLPRCCLLTLSGCLSDPGTLLVFFFFLSSFRRVATTFRVQSPFLYSSFPFHTHIYISRLVPR